MWIKMNTMSTANRKISSVRKEVRPQGFVATARVVYSKINHNPHYYLKHVTDVIHVGANLGQERYLYAAHGLKVLWIEPLPDIFCTALKNIESFPDQTDVNYLITDKDDTDLSYIFQTTMARLLQF